jgi:hypothetical protein
MNHHSFGQMRYSLFRHPSGEPITIALHPRLQAQFTKLYPHITPLREVGVDGANCAMAHVYTCDVSEPEPSCSITTSATANHTTH